MTWWIYDTEVFRDDHVAVFRRFDSDIGKDYAIFHNDPELLLEFLKERADDVFIGFNSKSYDQHIIKGIVGGMDNESLKDLSDFIVNGGNAWDCPLLDDVRPFWFNNCDIRDDMQDGLSLKAIEAHLGMDIEESEVDFGLDRPLTPEELERTIRYCCHDVDATCEIVKLRKGYLTNKVNVGQMAGLTPEKALSLTNARLTASLLKAKRRTYTDERRYVVPENLLKQYVPREVFDFFARMYDPSISDEVLFKSKLKLTIGGAPTVIAYGGIHAAIPNFEWREHDNQTIRNFDVTSYYPSLMIKNGYTSRSIPSPKVFEDVFNTRVAAKKAKDETTDKALKLVLNTTYGATKASFNDLYDPLMARSVCISGQLYLTELAEHLCEDVPGLYIVQLNTDGIMFCYENTPEHDRMVHEITDEWQKRTRFGLEEDIITYIAQKDVNNYALIHDGEEKCKGGYLVRGIMTKGAFNINNQAVIVADAISEYFLRGTPPAETINACDDILKFQLIAKAGSKYRDAYIEYAGKRQPVQKVNRVYASNDPLAGRISKIKIADDSEALIAAMPDHCVIDNRNVLGIGDIDKSWYITLAEKKINDFKGIKPGKGRATMAEKKVLNAYGRLLEARQKFLDAHVDKSGKHMQMQFKYFELDDLVPVAIPILREVGLIDVVNIDTNAAVMNVVNIDNPEDFVTFSIPFVSWDGNKGVNPLQVMGASVTYYRRYLLMIALDVCEPDEIDSRNSLQNPAPAVKPAEVKPAAVVKPAEAPKPAEAHKPAPVVKPAEAPAVRLTDGSAPATEMQMKNLKAALKNLRDAKPELRPWVSGIAVESQSFTKLTKSRCEAIMLEIAEKLK